MYSKIQVIRKLLIGAAALAVAICITIFIRENMDVNDPERALPSIPPEAFSRLRPESSRPYGSAYVG